MFYFLEVTNNGEFLRGNLGFCNRREQRLFSACASAKPRRKLLVVFSIGLPTAEAPSSANPTHVVDGTESCSHDFSTSAVSMASGVSSNVGHSTCGSRQP